MNTAGERLKILSTSDAPFADRNEAGMLLARELTDYAGTDTVVLGIPRGGMAIAAIIARALTAQLDVVISRKLRSPMNPELALGAVTESGKVFLDNRLIDTLSLDTPYIAEERMYQLGEIHRRAKLFRAVKSKAALTGKMVIITDDGLATGSTMQAAVWSARQEHPHNIIVALPVAPEDALQKIAGMADRTICLKAPADFFGVGQFYRDFPQIDDREVVDILKRS